MAQDEELRPGSVIVAQVGKATSYGAYVHYGRYTGAVTGDKPASGERIKVVVNDIQGTHFHGRRLD